MRKLLRTYEEILLGALAVICVVFLAGLFYWSIAAMLTEVNQALAQPEANSTHAAFNLDGARALNLKGQVLTGD